jgi:uncharacterized RDD family membrane protein YckC
MHWYYLQDSNRVGPVDEAQFEQLVAAGTIQPETLVWNERLTEWTTLREVRPAAGAAVPASGAGHPAAEAAESLATCSQCGNAFSRDLLMPFEGKMVCVNCKPSFLARLREGVPVAGRLAYAGFWPRFGAKFLDGLIMAVVYFILALLLLPSLMPRMTGRTSPADASYFLGSCLIQLAFYGLGAVYYVLFVGRYGATPGKMALKLKIVKADGSPVSYALALGRFFAEILSALILYVGYIMAAFDEEKRALHDRICNTRVVRV